MKVYITVGCRGSQKPVQGEQPGAGSGQDGRAGPDGSRGAPHPSRTLHLDPGLVGDPDRGFNLWGAWTSWPIVERPAPGLVAGGASSDSSSAGAPSSPRGWIHQGLAMVRALVLGRRSRRSSISTPGSTTRPIRPRLSTTWRPGLLAHGHDPYTSSLRSAALLVEDPERAFGPTPSRAATWPASRTRPVSSWPTSRVRASGSTTRSSTGSTSTSGWPA